MQIIGSNQNVVVQKRHLEVENKYKVENVYRGISWGRALRNFNKISL